MIRDMVAVNLLGLVSDRARIIELFHDLGVLHLHEEFAEVIAPETANYLKILRGKALGLIEALEWNDWSSVSSKDLEEKRGALYPVDSSVLKGIEESFDSFSERLNEQRILRAELEGRLNSLKTALRTLRHFETFIIDNHGREIDISIWWVQKNNPAEIISKIIKRIRDRDPLGSERSIPYHAAITAGGETVVAIAVSRDHQFEAESIFNESGCLPWLLPFEFETTAIHEAKVLMEIETNDIPRRIGIIDDNISRTRKLWGPKIGALFILLDDKTEQVLMEEGILTTGEMFRIEGWMPLDEKDDLVKIFDDQFKGRVFLRWREPGPSEWPKVPTALKNPAYFRPFELFLKLMPPINYRGLDPTILIGIFFPFFSGCMIGDLGYGAVILLLGLWLKNKRSVLLKDVGAILTFAAVWALFWGLAYGELFGDLGHRLFHLRPLWIERSEIVLPVMAFTVSLGFMHILIGYILGMLQGFRSGHRHLWIEKLGNIIILFALLSVMIIVKANLPKPFFTLTVISLVLGLALLLSGGGIGGLVESFGSLGNILSYVRIAAIGLSSAILAKVATSFVDSMGITFIGLFLALAIHLLNFVLALAGSGLHSARLQYVEFMGKFYQGGGIPYKPFSRRKEGSWKKH